VIALHRSEHETPGESLRAVAVPRLTDEAIRKIIKAIWKMIDLRWEIVTREDVQDAINNVVQDAIVKGIVGAEEEDAAIVWANQTACDIVRLTKKKDHAGGLKYADHVWASLTERIRAWMTHRECPVDPESESVEHHGFPAPNRDAGAGGPRTVYKNVKGKKDKEGRRVRVVDDGQPRKLNVPKATRSTAWISHYDLATQDERTALRETDRWDRRVKSHVEWVGEEGRWRDGTSVRADSSAMRARAEAEAMTEAEERAREEARTPARAELMYRIEHELPEGQRQIARLRVEGCTVEQIADRTYRKGARELKRIVGDIERNLGLASCGGCLII
jgi:hypothetical protein